MAKSKRSSRRKSGKRRRSTSWSRFMKSNRSKANSILDRRHGSSNGRRGQYSQIVSDLYNNKTPHKSPAGRRRKPSSKRTSRRRRSAKTTKRDSRRRSSPRQSSDRQHNRKFSGQRYRKYGHMSPTAYQRERLRKNRNSPARIDNRLSSAGKWYKVKLSPLFKKTASGKIALKNKQEAIDRLVPNGHRRRRRSSNRR